MKLHKEWTQNIQRNTTTESELLCSTVIKQVHTFPLDFKNISVSFSAVCRWIICSCISGLWRCTCIARCSCFSIAVPEILVWDSVEAAEGPVDAAAGRIVSGSVCDSQQISGYWPGPDNSIRFSHPLPSLTLNETGPTELPTPCQCADGDLENQSRNPGNPPKGP